ncbi:MAG TPA: metal-dependent hydrolase [Chitinophagales bacterium]|nr:metal-dependent hydrolase [Chitinophagales bacterium]
MASAFSHAIAAVAIGKASLIKNIDKKFWLLGMFCAVIPDADAIGFKLGIEYGSFWGHRGFSHSFVFAALLALAVTYFFYGEEKPLSKRWFAFVGFFFLATASHPVLDAMTTGGLGVAFLSPFDNTRYFFPFRPIKVSPIGITQFFGEWGWRVIKSEFIWVWIPSFIIMAIASAVKKLHSR